VLTRGDFGHRHIWVGAFVPHSEIKAPSNADSPLPGE
jgi:hypothetical protein